MKASPLFFALTLTPLLLAPALAGDGHSCVTISDNTARLACYDAAMGRVAPEAAPQAGKAAPQESKAAPQPDNAAADPTLPAKQVTAAQFGSEKLPLSKKEAQKHKALDKITATLASYHFNSWNKFTLTLTNGQIWQQDKSDSGRKAYIPHHDAVKVHISRGLLGSYNLSFGDFSRVYKVHRVK